MSFEHLDNAEIEGIQIDTIPESQAEYRVGQQGVTRIEAFTKSGMHSDIPYIRVWAGDEPIAEFCQHQIVGVYFKRREAANA